MILLAYQLTAEPKDRLRLVHANELENITDSNGKAIQYLRGNVEFRKGETVLTSERAYHNQPEGISSFTDSVRMEKNEQVLTVDSLVHDSNNDMVMGYGNNHFTDGEYTLRADTLTYFLEADSGIATGHTYFAQGKQTVRARKITYVKKEGDEAASYTAAGDVEIDEENRHATCGTSIYDAQSESSILLDDPMVTQQGETISGDEIHLSYQNEVLKVLIIPDRAHIVYYTEGKVKQENVGEDTTATDYKEEEFIDDMTGRRLEAHFIEGEIDSVRLEGMATTLYHLFEDSVYQGKNIASGDTITLLFAADSAGRRDMETIHIVGGARGEYHPDDSSEEIEAPIYYRADTMNYFIPQQQTTLTKAAQINYQDTQLQSGFVSVSWEDNLLHALPSPTPGEDAHYKQEELPTLIEKGRDPMVGESMVYNLSTGRGRVIHGKTKMEDGYYKGEEIRNRTRDVFFVSNSAYTTCNLDPDPHFHFQSRRMKMITDDKIIAKPIVLYVGGVPLMALPFGVFPDQGGKRHSGWIMPSYGEKNKGQFLDNLGYFWAVNDHWNSTFLLDFYDRWGILFENKNSYVKRYAFNGNLDLSYNRTIRTGDIADILTNPGATYWSALWNHRQRMRHHQSLNVSARYYSDNKFDRRLGIDRGTRLKQNAVSNATYTKRWPKQNISLSVNLSENRNLMAGDKTHPAAGSDSLYYQAPTKAGARLTETSAVLPTLSLRKGQSQLLGGSQQGGQGATFYWSYGSRLKNKRTGFYESFLDRTELDSIGVDSLGNTIYDTVDVFAWAELDHAQDNSWVHDISLSGSFRLLKHIVLRPSLTLKEGWVTRYFDADSATAKGNPVDKREVRRFRTRHTASFSLSSNTKLYGLFAVRIGPLLAIRHTITPSIGFTYQPDYSKPLFGYQFGYFKTIKDSTGKEHRFDHFSGTQIGATSARERRSLDIRLKNLLQAKVKQGDEEKKIDNLLNWSMSTSYNFVAPDYKLAKLRSSIRAKLPRKLSLVFSMTHDFYDFERHGDSVTRVNKIAKNKWGLPTPRLVDMSTSTGFHFSGKRLRAAPEDTSVEDTVATDTADYDLTEAREVSSKTAKQKPVSAGKLWDATISFRYSTSRFDPLNPKNKFWTGINLKLQLTKLWRIQYSARFDLLEKRLISHDFNVYRDLHCWELTFTWTPGGFGRGFYLRINVKSPNLSDLKVESRGGRWNLPYR